MQHDILAIRSEQPKQEMAISRHFKHQTQAQASYVTAIRQLLEAVASIHLNPAREGQLTGAVNQPALQFQYHPTNGNTRNYLSSQNFQETLPS